MDVEIPRDDPQPVRLLPLLRELDRDSPIPPITATLGIAEDGTPLLIRVPSPDVAHILVAGTTGSGKTMLLKSMLLSLALSNPAPRPDRHRPGETLSLILVDAQRGLTTQSKRHGFIASLLVTVLGLFLYTLFSYQRRIVELGILRAVGLYRISMMISPILRRFSFDEAPKWGVICMLGAFSNGQSGGGGSEYQTSLA